MQPTFTLGAQIPSLLWDSLEGALSANIHRLAKDIAKTLGQEPGPLLAALKAKKVGLFVANEGGDRDIEMRCDYVCRRQGTAFMMPCGQPILWCEKVRRCPEHMYLKATMVPARYMQLTPLSESGEPAQLFYAEDGVVYGADGAACGRYNAERKVLTLFEVEDEDEAAKN
jgi:hypothetical protein